MGDNSNKILVALIIIAFATVMFGQQMQQTVRAAAESVVILLQFNAASNHEVTWTLLGSFSSTSGSGTTCCGSRNIVFNCSAASLGVCTWVNATVSGTTNNASQNATDAILKADNTGNTNVNINISASSDINTVSACLDLTVFINTSQTTPCLWNALFNASAAQDLNTSVIPIDTSFTPSEAAICFWLNANFSNCTGTVAQENFLFGNSSD